MDQKYVWHDHDVAPRVVTICQLCWYVKHWSWRLFRTKTIQCIFDPGQTWNKMCQNQAENKVCVCVWVSEEGQIFLLAFLRCTTVFASYSSAMPFRLLFVAFCELFVLLGLCHVYRRHSSTRFFPRHHFHLRCILSTPWACTLPV